MYTHPHICLSFSCHTVDVHTYTYVCIRTFVLRSLNKRG